MKIISKAVKETKSIGAKIAKRVKKGDIIFLYGDLGSGKTVLAKGIASGLGIDQRSIISPTFVLLREYDSDLPLYHFDFYRLRSLKEIIPLGIEEYFYGNGLSVVEWPDRLGKFIPDEFLKVELKIKGNTIRYLEVQGKGEYYKKLAQQIYEDIRH